LAGLNQELNLGINSQETPRELQLQELGPLFDFTSWDDLHAYSASIWANATKQTDSVARGSGAQFFHFIQPNQYIEGAKPKMSAAERAVALVDPNSGQSSYGFWYQQGYPYLKEQQARLIEQGVKSHDLTFLYKDMPDEIYIDNCCHMNSKGNDIIVNAVVEKIHQFNQSK
jgi:hypothetical protein